MSWGEFCPGGFCPGDFVRGGFVRGGILSCYQRKDQLVLIVTCLQARKGQNGKKRKKWEGACRMKCNILSYIVSQQNGIPNFRYSFEWLKFPKSSYHGNDSKTHFVQSKLLHFVSRLKWYHASTPRPRLHEIRFHRKR